MASPINSNFIPAGGALTDAQRDASQDALTEVRQAVAKNIETKLDTTRQSADKFEQKTEAALLPQPADTAKAQTQFAKEFSPAVVSFLEQNLNVKMDPLKALAIKAQINADPAATQALSTFKDAIEQTNQEFLASWKPPALAPPPVASQPVAPTEKTTFDTELAQKAQSAAPMQVAAAQTQAVAQITVPLAAAKPTEKPPVGKQILTTDERRAEVADQKKITQTLVDSAKDPESLAQPAHETNPPLARGPAPAATADAMTVPSAPLPTAPPTTAGSQTGQGGAGGNGSSQPQWGQPGPLSPAQTKAALSFAELSTRVDQADVPECALVVLMDAVSDVDKDLKQQENLLDMRHKVNDAMRDYFKKFEHESAGLSGDQSLEWQQMSFDIGYQANGDMIVTSFPDVTWATGSYDHVEGKGAHDISPTDGFQNNTGANGMQEAQGNGSLHQVDSNTVIGLTAWRQIKVQSAPAEADFIRSQLSSMKQDNDVVTQELQKLMDLRKNILEQFGKIYQSRSDTWDQQIALLAQ
jgi:hypothetical protein